MWRSCWQSNKKDNPHGLELLHPWVAPDSHIQVHYSSKMQLLWEVKDAKREKATPLISSTSLPESFTQKAKLILRPPLIGHCRRWLSCYSYVIKHFSEHVAVVQSVQYGHAGVSGQSRNKSLRRFLQVDGLVCTEKPSAEVVQIRLAGTLLAHLWMTVGRNIS